MENLVSLKTTAKSYCVDIEKQEIPGVLVLMDAYQMEQFMTWKIRVSFIAALLSSMIYQT